MRTHFIGEQVEPTEAQRKEDKVLGSFPSRASNWKVLLVSMKVFWPLYAMFFLMFVFSVFCILFLIKDDLGIMTIIPLFVFLSFLILLGPVMLSLMFLELKNDRVEVSKDSIRIFFHYMVNMLMIYNSMEISDIKEVRVAGKDYIRERKQRTPLLDRFWTNPKPPPGGLHSMFHDPKALVIIEMVRPVPIVNLSTLIEKKIGWGPSLKRVYVKEVIVEIDRKYHDRFLSLLKELIEREKANKAKKQGFLLASRDLRTRMDEKGLKLIDLK